MLFIYKNMSLGVFDITILLSKCVYFRSAGLATRLFLIERNASVTFLWVL